ncbi:porin [Sphaerotilus montanus]|uniref:Putative porin n=1 Tax=Sphaerotilus montanus TaxID=522889 RepID=A0A7Y9U5G9_9BURK|nr:porin [Sphaerotilus montanus]NYG31661.1 putative porin [Sphaerotilus montanus]NZD58222.1 porin [Sphaerotilus montanus]
MKKSLLALAVLGAFAGAASAQSSVTLYGKVDLGVGKAAGTKDKTVMDGSGSRVGLKGSEDLGGGMKALFGFEHRFNPDTGTQNGAAFWQGYSTVGIGGAFGTVNLGRQYTSAFSLAQNVFDPFGGDSEGRLRALSLTPSTRLTTDAATAAATGAAKIRTQDSIRYDGTFAGLKIAADIAEGTATTKRPYSLAAQYAVGPVMVAASYENPGAAKDNLTTAGVAYTFGPAKLAAAMSTGKDADGEKIRGYLLGATVNVGPAGQVLAGYAQLKEGTATPAKKASVGYRHNLSKRTQLYADFSRVNEPALSLNASTGRNTSEKNAYDFGVLHAF